MRLLFIDKNSLIDHARLKERFIFLSSRIVPIKWFYSIIIHLKRTLNKIHSIWEQLKETTEMSVEV